MGSSPVSGAPVLVTGAGGFTGKHVARLLLERGNRVRALVRSDDARAQKLARNGAEVIVGDLLKFNDIAAALDGVRAAYFVYPLAPGLIEASTIFAQACADSGVQGIVNMSQVPARRDAGSNASQQHWITERMFEHYPTPVTHVRPTLFAEWFIYFGRSIATDSVLRLPLADARHAPVSAADQAQVIAAIMADPAPHAGKSYSLYGPEEMNHYEIARVMSDTLGRTIKYEPIELEEFTQRLNQEGRPPHLVQHLTEICKDYRNGIFAGTNDLVRQIGHAEPVTVARFIEENRRYFEPR
jgi:uncharacterized protein YbjT (DUF2867 family)